MLTYTSVVRASVEGLAAHSLGDLFLASRHFFWVLDSLCLFRRKPFLVSQSLSLLEFVASNWLVLEATGCEQRELSLLCCGSTSMIPAAKL